ncbi:hypothetical protein NQ317_017843 [Molorchus minor]|uniref:Uncharacterized protein n=1 Tax=Molorchus minor TaxID=1323400 RepID=A0ABQ9JZG6_9CUCU|nr:hypothetical protein NQ317_017843 [Molorchus minor]
MIIIIRYLFKNKEYIVLVKNDGDFVNRLFKRWIFVEVLECPKCRKKHITLKSLNSELAQRCIIEFSKTSLQRLLPEIGFKFKKDDTRRFLVETPSICMLRSTFLRKCKRNEESSNPLKVIFLDKTWIYSKGNPKKSWQDASTKSVKRPAGYDGKRFIVLHAGGEDGFIPGASLLCASRTKLQDYHGEMNVIKEYGHEVLRTPPYQCEFNAIELIWANCKSYYNTHIGEDGYGDDKVLLMWKKALDQVTTETWKNCVRYTNNIINEWYNKIIVDEVQPVIINLNEESDTEDSE